MAVGIEKVTKKRDALIDQVVQEIMDNKSNKNICETINDVKVLNKTVAKYEDALAVMTELGLEVK